MGIAREGVLAWHSLERRQPVGRWSHGWSLAVVILIDWILFGGCVVLDNSLLVSPVLSQLNTRSVANTALKYDTSQESKDNKQL